MHCDYPFDQSLLFFIDPEGLLLDWGLIRVVAMDKIVLGTLR